MNSPLSVFTVSTAWPSPFLSRTRVISTEFDPPDRRTRSVAEARIEHVLVAGMRRRGHPHQDGGNRQSLSLPPELEHCGPRFSCWDHTSHKGFAPRLSTASRIETNTGKTSGYFDLYLNRIRLKFEVIAIE